MEKVIGNENLLLCLTRQLLDLKLEKKKYNADMNEAINNLEVQIRSLVTQSPQG